MNKRLFFIFAATIACGLNAAERTKPTIAAISQAVLAGLNKDFFSLKKPATSKKQPKTQISATPKTASKEKKEKKEKKCAQPTPKETSPKIFNTEHPNSEYNVDGLSDYTSGDTSDAEENL